MQVSNAAHGRARRIGDQNAFIAGNCERQRTNGGGLVDDKEELAMRLEFGDEGPQLGLIVRPRLLYRRVPARSRATA
jgi:hypothetical protein